MLTIWGRTTSLNVQKVMWAAAELGLTVKRIDVGGPFGGLDTAEFGALNPNRTIPVLQDGAFTLWESNAIVRYLADAYPRAGFSPSGAQEAGLAGQWMDWSATSLYSDIVSTCFMGLIRTPAAQRDAAAIAAAAERVGQRLKVLDAHLAGRNFILGDELTTADIPVGAMMYRYFTLPIARPSLPAVEAWYGRLSSTAPYRIHVMVDYAAMKVPGA